ncbi:MAG TPA: NlpC/P60 family protein [Streptosporangiaceae bacterium]|nr:NlpC/P60 family protein [Streptosporangiaceae bacterium]HLN71296.1 NlpC/P60 family protein [Streptosporangiaceae bacterium]
MRKVSGAACLATATATVALLVPAVGSNARVTSPQPSLGSLVAQARQLEFQINALSEQYDGLRIQLSRAQADVQLAEQAAARAATALAGGQLAVAQLAAENYMDAGLDPALQALAAGNPGQFLSQESVITELDQASSDRASTLSNEEGTDQRARQTAGQQLATVQALEAAMNAKKAAITARIDQVNSAAMKQAMAIFTQTGQYPDITIPTANTVGAQALAAALSRRGDPYVWGAAGPGTFDCSGLVVWAFAQEGIALPHYTGDLWNSGVHIPRADLEPGDLVFFFPDISHVGIYLGDGLMVDAPDFGETVRVEPVYWAYYVGAVRIG